MAEFSYIDLFAGIGGLRIGFDKMGGKCVFSSEIDKFARQTYEENYGHLPKGDITEIPEESIPAHDLVLAGFPCQPFSLAGVSKYNSLGWDHGFNHEVKGTLFFDVVRIIEYHQPKAFLLENVKNLRSHDKGRTWKVIESTLTNLGYNIHSKVIDAKLVVPQHRERIFIVGFREDVDFQFPEINPKNRKLKHILDKNVPEKYTLSDHLWQYLQDYKEKHRKRGNGFGYGMVTPEDISRTLSARYNKDGSEILIEQPGMNPRRLTPRECSRLMGFPSNFKIPVSDTQAYRQFGNAVIASLVEHLAKAIIEALRNHDLLSETIRVVE
jgi:DNA (cytosine-5)-methyltransferase 1